MKPCSNVCNRCRLVCVKFKSEQICSCCCKMLRGSLFWDTWYRHYINKSIYLSIYNTYTLSVCLSLCQNDLLYRTKADIQQIDAEDQWCLRRIPDINYLHSDDIHRTTNEPPLSSIIKSRRLTFFGHLA